MFILENVFETCNYCLKKVYCI